MSRQDPGAQAQLIGLRVGFHMAKLDEVDVLLVARLSGDADSDPAQRPRR